MTDDRSERLRRRRQQSRADIEQRDADASELSKPDDPAQTGDLSQPDAPSKPDEPSQPPSSGGDRDGAAGNGHDTVSIKEEQIGTYMYLPESQTKELQRLYNVLKAEYEFEYEEEFEKNRHFYPLVVQYGLDGLDSLSAQEVRERLENLS